MGTVPPCFRHYGIRAWLEAATANPYDELFGKMFNTGRVVQDEYQKNVDNIFDQYLGGMNKK